MWKDIPGYEGRYQASTDGEIARLRKRGGRRNLKPYLKKGRRGSDTVFVHLTMNGETKEKTVIRIMCETFFGGVPEGYVPVHKNGLQSDNSTVNIQFITQRECGKRYGKLARKEAVAKFDIYGNKVEVYPSARECARNNFMSYQTILDRCNGKCITACAPDGYIYIYDRRSEKVKNSWIPTTIGRPPKETEVEFIVRKNDTQRKLRGWCLGKKWHTTGGHDIAGGYVVKWRVIDVRNS